MDPPTSPRVYKHPLYTIKELPERMTASSNPCEHREHLIDYGCNYISRAVKSTQCWADPVNDEYKALVQFFSVYNPMEDTSFIPQFYFNCDVVADPEVYRFKLLQIKRLYDEVTTYDPRDLTADKYYYAIFSLLFKVPDKYLSVVSNTYLMQLFADSRKYNRSFIYTHEAMPSMNCFKFLFKLINKAYNYQDIDRNVFCNRFYLTDFLENPNVIDNLQKYYIQYLKTNTFPMDMLKENLRLKYVDYDLPKKNIRYVTGHACVGKSTTVLKTLKDLGHWEILSRGDLGTFAGKSKSGSVIAGLHNALTYAFENYNVIGDRGLIDNPLWTFIMENVSRTKQYDLVHEFVSFINSSFNMLSLMEFCRHKAVIILDEKCLANRSRMLHRAEGGDWNRARIKYYTHVQGMCYFMVAKMFNWPIFFVPYKKNSDEIDREAYMVRAREICRFFGYASPTVEPLNDVLRRKPGASYAFVTDVSSSLGIYK